MVWLCSLAAHADLTIYFDNSGANFSTPYVFYWGGTPSSQDWDHPTAMTKYQGDIWQITVPNKSNVIFRSQDGNTQSIDVMSVQNGYVYGFIKKDTSGEPILSTDINQYINSSNNDNPDMVTVYLDVFDSNEVPSIYYWKGSENVGWNTSPSMTPYSSSISGHKIYSYQIPANREAMIFRLGSTQTLTISQIVNNRVYKYYNSDDISNRNNCDTNMDIDAYIASLGGNSGGGNENPDQPDPDLLTVYLDAYGCSSTPLIYWYGNGNNLYWDDSKTMKFYRTVNGHNIYYYDEVPKNLSLIIFRDGTSSQTADITTIVNNHVYLYYIKNTENQYNCYTGKDIDTYIAELSAPQSYPHADMTPTGTLPVLYINTWTDKVAGEYNYEITDYNLADKEYRDGEYWIDLKNCNWMTGAANVGSAEEPLPLSIKARGNYTRTGFSKKPFKIKLGKKQNLLNINRAGQASKHWALITGADDNFGYLRNYAGFVLGEKIGLPWTPNMQPIEVVINGNYRGIYFLTESVRLEKGRVDITELADDEPDSHKVSGGYLVELDNYTEDASTQIFINDLLKISFEAPEIYSSPMRSFVTQQFNTMNQLVNSKSNDLWKYLDLDDAARYYIVMELLGHWEAYHGSTYLFRDYGNDQKWHFSPVWDLGHAFDADYNKHFYECNPFNENTWVREMLQNNMFKAKVSETWKWFMTNCYTDFISQLTSFKDHVQQAATRDYERWHDQPLPASVNENNPTQVVDNINMSDRLNTVTTYLNNRIGWMQQYYSLFGNYNTNNPSDYPEPNRDTTTPATLPTEYRPLTYSRVETSGSLPVIYVNTTDNASIGYGDAGLQSGVLFVDDPSSSTLSEEPLGTTIKGRSLTAWNDASQLKKPYKIVFTDGKVELLGMTKSKHFALQPYADDYAKAMLSNYTGHAVSQAIGMPWTPSMKPVELVINGVYQGLYFVAESVRADEANVPVTAADKKKFNPEYDWIIEYNVNAGDEANFKWGNNDVHQVIAVSPEINDPELQNSLKNPAQYDLIQPALESNVNNLINVASNASTNIYSLDWADTFDAEQAVKYAVVQEIMDDPEAYRSNFFFYRSLDGIADNLWHIGPVWNFSNAFASEDASRNSLALDANNACPFMVDLYENNAFRWLVGMTFLKFTSSNGDAPTNAPILATPAFTIDKRNEVEALFNQFNIPGSFDDVRTAITDMAATINSAYLFDLAHAPGATARSARRHAPASGATAAASAIINALDRNVTWLGSPSGAGWDVNPTPTGLDAIQFDNDAEVEYFDVLGRRVDNPTPGAVYIMRRGALVTKQVL